MNSQKTSGIYQIRQISTGKLYIGSSVNLTKRQKDHFNALRRNKHDNAKLQNSYNKYGASDFSFEVLVTYPNTQIIKLEQSFLDGFKPFFNINPTAANCTGRKFSEETKKKMSESAKRRAIPQALLDNQKPKLGPKAPKKKHKSRVVPGSRRAFAISKGTKILASKNGVEISFFSMRDAAKFIGSKCSKSGIRLALKFEREYYGFKWSKI